MAPKKPFVLPPFEMTEFGANLLDDIRNTLETHQLYGRDPKVGDELVSAVLNPAMAGAPIPSGAKLQYLWFLRELVRVFRTRSGPELAMQVELVLQKWFRFGLKVEMMQWLLASAWGRVKQAGSKE